MYEGKEWIVFLATNFKMERNRAAGLANVLHFI